MDPGRRHRTRFARFTSGRTGPAGSGSKGSAVPRTPRPSHAPWTGISGWDPVQARPYHPAYAPVSWRGWRDFGTGALGDMGCHIIDHPVWALGLGAPTSVEARTTLDGSFLDGDKPNFETYPIASIITSTSRRGRDATRPDDLVRRRASCLPTPREMPAGQSLPDNGVLYIGSKGKMYHSSHGGMPELLPHALHEQAATVPKTMTRSPGHYEEWVEACKGGPRPVSNFDYAGPMTEIVLLGVLALRARGDAWNGTARTSRSGTRRS